MSRLLIAAALTVTGCATDTGLARPFLHRPAHQEVSRSAHRPPLASTPNVLPVKARSPLPVGSHDLRETADVSTVTAYCATGSRNAAGKWPTLGTAAANAYPLGTRLHVEGVGVVTVEDRSAPGATDVDIYLGDGPDCEAAAAAFGRRYLHVWQDAA